MDTVGGMYSPALCSHLMSPKSVLKCSDTFQSKSVGDTGNHKGERNEGKGKEEEPLLHKWRTTPQLLSSDLQFVWKARSQTLVDSGEKRNIHQECLSMCPWSMEVTGRGIALYLVLTEQLMPYAMYWSTLCWSLELINYTNVLCNILLCTHNRNEFLCKFSSRTLKPLPWLISYKPKKHILQPSRWLNCSLEGEVK